MKRNPTRRRVLVLSRQIDSMQAALGRADLSTARRLAAELAAECEDLTLALLNIPPAERARYTAPNPYYPA
ncbi:TPA: hypothetical protein ACWS6R_000086 [Klebsiella pneumoniae]|uniref:hypothetical protein n=1 Tax=Klebsiella sp. GG_Kp140 TaxID=3153451 RepID=UPI0032B55DA7|nr:hypothetical protein [Klebsiella pneumoniae]